MGWKVWQGVWVGEGVAWIVGQGVRKEGYSTPQRSRERIFEQARGGAAFWVWVFLAVREGVRLILWYEQPPANHIRQHRFEASGAVKQQLVCRFCADAATRRPQQPLWAGAE
ncbi:hypothetical protein E4U52_001999 [Claviceps spartinae]|nr:hypothetical protein E4U52_001999 [Claviceps spartinae]